MSEVEDTIKRLSSHSGVLGIVIVNAEGVAIRSSLDSVQTKKYAQHITSLAAKARSVVRDLDPQNDLMFLRLRSRNDEIMIAPDKEFTLIVIQETAHN